MSQGARQVPVGVPSWMQRSPFRQVSAEEQGWFTGFAMHMLSLQIWPLLQLGSPMHCTQAVALAHRTRPSASRVRSSAHWRSVEHGSQTEFTQNAGQSLSVRQPVQVRVVVSQTLFGGSQFALDRQPPEAGSQYPFMQTGQFEGHWEFVAHSAQKWSDGRQCGWLAGQFASLTQGVPVEQVSFAVQTAPVGQFEFTRQATHFPFDAQ